MSYKQVLTDAGRDVIARGQTGLTITFSRVSLGEGELTDPAVIPTLTGMIEPVMDANIVGVAHTEVGQVTITAKVPLASIPRDFHLYEIGIFARIGNETEVLYGYSYATDLARAQIITQEMAGGSKNEHTLQIAVVIGTTENVTAVFAPDFEIINIGTPEQGIGWYKDRIGNTFRFKRFAASGDVELTEEEDDIRLSFQGVPTGASMVYYGQTTPNGWLRCDGTQYLKADYPQLANVLGNTYGGDALRFAVPDCRDRVIVGAGLEGLGARGGARTHLLTVQEMPSHNHNVTDEGHNHTAVASAAPHNHYLRENPHVHPVNSMPIDHRDPGTGGTWRSIEWTDYPQLTTYFASTGITIDPANVSVSVILNPAISRVSVQANGGSMAHNNMQPYLVANYIIRT